MHPYKRLLNRTCRKLRGGTLTLDYWDGSRRRFGRGEPQVRLKINQPAIVPRLLLDPELAFGEAYMRGELEIDGRLNDLMRIVGASIGSATIANTGPIPAALEAAFEAVALFSRWRPLSTGTNRRDIVHHYDLGNEFYALWLDPTMTYSCAYFKTREDSLEIAQRQKIAHLIAKLQLKPGESLLDVGCGWGSLLSEAARSCQVKALGITLSDEQVAWFDAHLAPDLQGRARLDLQHYHDLAAKVAARQIAPFDKIVSVGMAEHVGRHNLATYLGDLKRLLRPGGIGVLHLITAMKAEPTSAWLVKYIFPGGYIPSFAEIVSEMSRHDLVIHDVENLGQHYALTLDRWSENFERHTDRIAARYGAQFVRMWRLYLLFSAASFREEDIYVHQIVFTNGKPANYPLTREFLYPPQ